MLIYINFNEEKRIDSLQKKKSVRKWAAMNDKSVPKTTEYKIKNVIYNVE